MIQRSPFRHFKTSPEIIRLAVMFYIRFPLSLRNVEDLLRERGIEICQGRHPPQGILAGVLWDLGVQPRDGRAQATGQEGVRIGLTLRRWTIGA